MYYYYTTTTTTTTLLLYYYTTTNILLLYYYYLTILQIIYYQYTTTILLLHNYYTTTTNLSNYYYYIYRHRLWGLRRLLAVQLWNYRWQPIQLRQGPTDDRCEAHLQRGTLSTVVVLQLHWAFLTYKWNVLFLCSKNTFNKILLILFCIIGCICYCIYYCIVQVRVLLSKCNPLQLLVTCPKL